MEYDIEKVKAARRDAQMTQEQLWEAVKKRYPPKGVSLSGIQQMESGSKSGRFIIERIARTLGCDPADWLLSPPRKMGGKK